MTATALQLLAVAKKEIGVKESPKNSNNVKYTRWYPMVGEPWCAMFTSWCMDQVGGLGTLMIKHAYTPAGVDWFKSKGLWHPSRPKPGDVVYYDFPGPPDRVSHTGFVEHVYTDGSIDAIEGNTDEAGGRTGGQVMRQHRSKSIVGYGRPQYGTGGGGGGGGTGGDEVTYYCEIGQNTGQEVSPGGEDIRMQKEYQDPQSWHSGEWPSMTVDKKIRGIAMGTVYVTGPAEVRLCTYSSENVRMRTVATETVDTSGYASLSGPVTMSEGHKLRLWVNPASATAPVTARSALLSLQAQDA